LYTQVSEIDAEYFPPREDVILQNEAPSDVYILVSGAAVNARKLILENRFISPKASAKKH